MQGQNAASENVVAQTPATDPVTIDTATVSVIEDSSAQANNNDTPRLLTFDVILNTYTTLSGAKKRLDRLTAYGNKVKLAARQDSTAFHVVLPVENILPEDTAQLMDSLTRVFSPRGVSILER
jgi:hypothetical protein